MRMEMHLYVNSDGTIRYTINNGKTVYTAKDLRTILDNPYAIKGYMKVLYNHLIKLANNTINASNEDRPHRLRMMYIYAKSHDMPTGWVQDALSVAIIDRYVKWK